MALTTDELAQVATMINDSLAQNAPIGRDGVVIPGSYDPERATVDVALCDTLVVFPGDQTQSPAVEYSVPLATTHLDDAHGPPANALVHLIPTQTGYTCLLYRTPEPGVDSPVVPAYERWISLKGLDGKIVAFLKFTLDGSTVNDKLGAIRVLAGGLLSIATAGGFSVTADDTAKKMAFASPGGLSVTLDDNLDRVLIGKTGLSVPDSVITQTDLQTALNAMTAAVQAAFTTFAAHVESGSGTTPPTVAGVTASGSSVVESEE